MICKSLKIKLAKTDFMKYSIKCIRNYFKCLIPLLFLMLISCKEQGSESIINDSDYKGWTNYAGTKDGMRYSSNTEITNKNVHQLKLTWSYSTNDRSKENKSQNQCNPIIIDGVLFGVSPRSKLFALNAATGKQKWLFDPATNDINLESDPNSFYKVIRGVVFWKNEDGSDQRILYSSGSRTYCINAYDGELIKTFGKGGFIDLDENLGRDDNNFNPFVAATSPGIVYKNLIIIGHRVSERIDAAPGPIRAYSVITGQLQWTFNTIPRPGEKGYETWPDKDAWKRLGGANNWAGMSLDEKTGLLYVPTGSIAGDFYGGMRKGKNLFANSLICIEAATGKYVWHYQIVHHDLWDRDLAANPNLVTLHKNGNKIDAVAQITKHGYVFLFERKTGKPIFPIEEKKFPQKALPGEEPWPTQPIPTLPEPFARQHFSRDDVTDLDFETHRYMLEKFDKIESNEMFTPPSKEGVLDFSWV